MQEGSPQLPLPGEELLEEGGEYKIVGVEIFTSDLQGWKGFRVTLENDTEDLLAIPLWVREIWGRRSKGGAFMVALGEDMDKWVGRKIKIIKWLPRDREIREVG